MLIDPPDGVLAEASAVKPRPTIASSLQVAEPATRIAWWPDLAALSTPLLSRLAWMIGAASGTGWIVLDDGTALPDLTGTGLRSGDTTPLPDGTVAYEVRAAS